MVQLQETKIGTKNPISPATTYIPLQNHNRQEGNTEIKNNLKAQKLIKILTHKLNDNYKKIVKKKI